MRGKIKFHRLLVLSGVTVTKYGTQVSFLQ